MSPTVSIVLPSFNQRPFLEEAINSILNQEYEAIELIVMDGGSTDGSIELIESHRSRIAHCHIGPDGGPAAALNTGFSVATGSVFAYLNSDDVLLPQAARRWVETLQQTAADIVYGDIRIIDAAGANSHLPGKRVSRFKATSFSRRRMAAGGCTIPQQGAAWRREVHEAVGGFEESNRSCWDGEFFVDAAIAGFKFSQIPEELGLFRVHDESISGTGKHAEARRMDHARIGKKWTDAGLALSQLEKTLWVRWGQIHRAWRYLSEAGT